MLSPLNNSIIFLIITLSTLVRNSSCQDSTSIQNINTTTNETNNNIITANGTNIYNTPGFMFVYATSYKFMSFNTIGITYMLIYPVMHHSQWKEPYCPILAVCKEVYWNCGRNYGQLQDLTVILSLPGVHGYGANKYL
ncbi:hypothetical protein Glove_140g38 [Diversispora epigaea]|uniref:Uncharacterized protein n=1 Tax=Diversispora epigaea TaxID=1348612 RepID=A0A397IXY0_9GLOM|nr:hypothetical protein Glove_140g38 [Diversispora epigaea]